MGLKYINLILYTSKGCIFMKKLKELFKKYNHVWVLLYALIYMPWFTYLERHVTAAFYLIHSPLDDYIPFVEYFIVPYLLWFVYLAAGACFLFFKDKKGFLQAARFAISGMTIFLIICTIFPNGLALRPTIFAHDNVFVDLVKIVYSTDTPTNVLPSMHVFLSVGMCMALNRTPALKDKHGIRIAAGILSFIIVLSTMFLKQHSVTDVAAALVMDGILYQLVYARQARQARKLMHEPVI